MDNVKKELFEKRALEDLLYETSCGINSLYELFCVYLESKGKSENTKQTFEMLDGLEYALISVMSEVKLKLDLYLNPESSLVEAYSEKLHNKGVSSDGM